MTRPKISLLRKFIPLNEWKREQLELLASAVEIEFAKIGETLIKRESSDELSYYLINGKVLLIAEDGKTEVINAEDSHGATPLSQLLPRKYQVTCVSPIEYICIENHLIYETVARKKLTGLPEGYEVDEEEYHSPTTSISNQLTKQLEQDLKHDRLNLPSLPEVASRVGRAIEDETCNANSIARIIQTDPAITAKIVKAANSAFYGSQNPVESCSQAVIRLGTRVTHNLVINYTMRDLFQTKSKLLNKRMHELWKHSIKVAAISYVLAKHLKRFSADEAMAIGLLHDIGIAAILNNASSYPDLASDPAAIDHAIHELRGPFGSRILTSWRFPEQYITAAEEAENWMRMGEFEPDYCDILVIAQLHSFIGTKKAQSIPPLDKVPAIPRLNLGPRQSLVILGGAKEQIEETMSLLKH